MNIFKAASPHQAYRQKLISMGLDRTVLGSSWLVNAEKSLENGLNISIPYQETGYFAAEKSPVSVYRFTARRGEKLTIRLIKKPIAQFMIYVDVWELAENGKQKLIASADTTGHPLEFDIKSTGTHLIRLQPELLSAGQYTLEIASGPSLAFPLKSSGRAAIQSYFGDGRDANSRKHEGIDIFAPFRTPVLAAAPGIVQRVNENNLGGKVVWMRPTGKDYTLYYAHLDEQIATEGQQVLPGDTLGLMGNTGNARSTAPHLHFGIYTSGGAIDPYPFVDPAIRPTPAVSAPLNLLNSTVRSTRKVNLYTAPDTGAPLLKMVDAGTIMQVSAASDGWYTVQLPDNSSAFIKSGLLSSTVKPLRKLKIDNRQQDIYDQPDSLAAVKRHMAEGQTVDLLGSFNHYYFIGTGDNLTGWIRN